MDTRLILALLASGCMGLAQASWRDVLPGAQAVGAGEMRWFGLKLYDAQLFSSAKPLDPRRPYALVLTYARQFQAKRIVAASLEQMEKLGAPKAQFPRWAEYMQRGFVDVQAGERITGVHLPGQGARFYAGERLTAAIDDPEFAQWFFAIWLDAKTSEPGLRRQLLGEAQ
ncbi:chalcone isomerase family protein [Chitinimonas taiwanensis]|uniref:chalcone isomerase family protein n=1 Tax=Chitinimonas taiwanensis TaxID=240412 RepID=UPI0035B0A701